MRRSVWGSSVILVVGVGLLGWQVARQKSATPSKGTEGGRLCPGLQTSLFSPMPATQANGTHQPYAATRARVIAGYDKLPLQFEANRGQADKRVKFLSRGRGYTMFLTDKAEAVLALSSGRKEERGSGRGPGALHKMVTHSPTRPLTHSSIIRIKLVNANPKPRVIGAEELPGKVNYFLGNDPKKWRTNVPTYEKVRYESVYPGIDLAYYGNQQGRFEHDFIVAPGANPKRIALSVNTCSDNFNRSGGVGKRGKERMNSLLQATEITRDGNLVLHTSGGDLAFHKPLAYQDTPDGRKKIAARYALNPQSRTTINHQPSTITFGLGSYDPSLPLIIDPVLSYSTYLGGSDTDEGYGIAVDSSGDAYVTGYTRSTDFPTVSPLQANHGGGINDAFVAKLNAAGSALVYSTYLGGSGWDVGDGIAVDGAGNAYVTGWTTSPNFPTVSPLQANKGGGYRDAFVAKLNAAGSALVYSTYLGGSNEDWGLGIAVDRYGNAYITGYTGSTDFPTSNPLQAKHGGYDAFVAKLNAAGSAFVYSTYLGGSGDDYGSGIAADRYGNAYVTGETGSTDFPTFHPLQANYGGGYRDAFVAKLNAGGSALVYSTYLGGSLEDEGTGIAVDGAGNAYVVGRTDSTDFPTANPLQTYYGGGGYDAFVAKLNAAGGALVYSTFLGGSGVDVGLGIAVDTSGNAYVTGDTASPNFPTISPLQANYGGGGSDAFVAKLNAGGSALVYSTYLGGSGSDEGYCIAVDGAGNAYVTGDTASPTFPTVSPLQANFGGSADAFVAKIGGEPPTVTSITLNSGLNNGPLAITNLAGTGFLTGATVKLTMSGQSDITATSVNVVSATQITCTFDLTGKAAGQWNVVVTNTDSQSGTLTNGFTITNPAPTMTSITPNTGVNTGTINITNLAGTGFLAGATVKLTQTNQPDIAATNVSVVSASQITCTFDLTGKTAGQRNVVVTNTDTQSATLTNGFTITNPAPTVTSITPASGLNTGSVSITNLVGTGFLTGATVKLTKTGQSDINATSVTVVSATQMTCSFDLNGKAAGQWNVVVTNIDSQSGTLNNGFTVLANTGGIYVDQNCAGSVHDGSSWATAYTDLAPVLSTVVSPATIYVAKGTYKPTTGTDRTATFQLKNGVTLMGGYPTGGGTRNPAANVTTLSGDIGAVGNNSDNSYHVVTGSGTDSTAVLDGFTVTGGNANGGSFVGSGMYNNGGSPSVQNVTFSDNTGGVAMYNYVSSSPTLTNVTFSDNTGGSAMYNYVSSSPTLTNVTFSRNSDTGFGGGGMHNENFSSPTLTNVTFSGNNSTYDGGGMFNWNNCSPSLTNVTFSGNNTTAGGGGVFNYAGSPTLTNVTFSDNSASHSGGGMDNESGHPTLTNVTFIGRAIASKNGV